MITGRRVARGELMNGPEIVREERRTFGRVVAHSARWIVARVHVRSLAAVFLNCDLGGRSILARA
jgi:hypothetical protein